MIAFVWTVAITGPVSILAPQIWRTISTKSIEGVEITALRLGIAATVGWIFYGISKNLWLISVANVIALALLMWIAKLCADLSSDVQLRSFAYFPLLYGTVLLSLTGQSTIPIGLTCSLFSLIGPLLQLTRTFKNLRLVGLSALTYVSAIFIHITWIAYGLSINNPYIILPNFYGFSIASLILMRITLSRWSMIAKNNS